MFFKLYIFLARGTLRSLSPVYSVTTISHENGKDGKRETEITGTGTREKLLIGFKKRAGELTFKTIYELELASLYPFRENEMINSF